ncbi:MAG: polysaccharide synthesis protein GtrA [Burkholderia sp.]|jgi:putative flippase GtrA|nr:polysaccharide synthesis protein GtrA [Burkholderia sp.]
MGRYCHNTMTKSTLAQFLRFGISGGIGFVVDVAVLYLALAAGANFYWGRGISFLCAVFATWQINRNFAFKPSGSMSLWQEWGRYLLAMLGGGIINYLASAVAVALLPPGPMAPMIGVAIGSIAGMSINFISSKLFVFR